MGLEKGWELSTVKIIEGEYIVIAVITRQMQTSPGHVIRTE